MNSMFSMFDALAAELLLGNFVRASSSVPSFTPNSGAAGGGGSTASSAPLKPLPSKKEEATAKSKNSSMKPRFALEFDGLNCFETLVPN